MKTEYVHLIADLIHNLEESLHKDMGIPSNRYYCSSNMYRTYYDMSSVEEKQLATWIMNKGADLEIEPLDDDHPRKLEEIQEYKELLSQIVKYLKTTLPDDFKIKENKQHPRPN